MASTYQLLPQKEITKYVMQYYAHTISIKKLTASKNINSLKQQTQSTIFVTEYSLIFTKRIKYLDM